MASPNSAPTPPTGPSPAELAEQERNRLRGEIQQNEVVIEDNADDMYRNLAASQRASDQIDELEIERLRAIAEASAESVEAVREAARTVDYKSSPGLDFKPRTEQGELQYLVSGDERRVGLDRTAAAARSQDELDQSGGGLRLESHSMKKQTGVRAQRLIGWTRRTLGLGDPLTNTLKYSGRERHGDDHHPDENTAHAHLTDPEDGTVRYDNQDKDPYHYNTVAHHIRTRPEAVAMVASTAEHNVNFIAGEEGRKAKQIPTTADLRKRALDEHHDPSADVSEQTYRAEIADAQAEMERLLPGASHMSRDEIKQATDPVTATRILDEADFINRTQEGLVDIHADRLIDLDQQLASEGEAIANFSDDTSDMVRGAAAADRTEQRVEELFDTRHELRDLRSFLPPALRNFSAQDYQQIGALRGQIGAARLELQELNAAAPPHPTPAEQARLDAERQRLNDIMDDYQRRVDVAMHGFRPDAAARALLADIAEVDSRRQQLETMLGRRELSTEQRTLGNGEITTEATGVYEAAAQANVRRLGIIGMHAAVDADLPTLHLGTRRAELKKEIDDIEATSVAVHGRGSDVDINRALQRLQEVVRWQRENAHLPDGVSKMESDIMEQDFKGALEDLGISSLAELAGYGIEYDATTGTFDKLDPAVAQAQMQALAQKQARARATVASKREQWAKYKKRIEQNLKDHKELTGYEHRVLGRRVLQLMPDVKADGKQVRHNQKRQGQLLQEMDERENAAIINQNTVDRGLSERERLERELASI